MINYNGIIQRNSHNDTYCICIGNVFKQLNNFNYSKIFTLTIIDIIIDLNNKNYKIITYYFPIFYCNNDINILYNKLNSKLYYFEINNLNNYIFNNIYKFNGLNNKNKKLVL